MLIKPNYDPLAIHVIPTLDTVLTAGYVSTNGNITLTNGNVTATNGLLSGNNVYATTTISAGTNFKFERGVFDTILACVSATGSSKTITFPDATGTVALTSNLSSYLLLAGGTLVGNLLFSADATYNIGASGATRPRDLFLSGNAIAGGFLSLNNGGNDSTVGIQQYYARAAYPTTYRMKIETGHVYGDSFSSWRLSGSNGENGFIPHLSTKGNSVQVGLLIGGAVGQDPTSLVSLDLVANSPTIRQSVERASGYLAFELFQLTAKNTTSGLRTEFGRIGVFGNLDTSPTYPSCYYMYIGSSPTTNYDAAVLKINATGIGINLTGTTAPSVALDVTGAALISTTLGVTGLTTATGGINVATGAVYKLNNVQVVGARVVDARCDDAIDSGDATTDGVIDALRDAMIAHGLIAAA